MIADHDFDDYRNRRVLVMGLGSFGGGVGVVKFLVARGAAVTVTDLRPAEKLTDSLNELRKTPPDRLVLGVHQEADFQSADLIVVNPAVKRDGPYLNAAIRAGVPVTSEMNLFWKWNPAPVVAVTGSNGKSTTTAMTFTMIQRFLQLQPNRRAWLGGNIGSSLLPVVDQIRPSDIVVLELSSFQLVDLDRIQASPNVAVVTNFAPNHLDWHPNLDHYRSSKQAILRWQTTNDLAVLNDDDEDVRHWQVRAERLGFGLHDCGSNGVFLDGRDANVRLNEGARFRTLRSGASAKPERPGHPLESTIGPLESTIGNGDSGRGQQRLSIRDWLKLPGEHNIANTLAATAAAVAVGVDGKSIQWAIENYEPLPHRLQFVGTVAGRRFYNDSLATTPESTEVALAAFDAPIVLLAGGYDKNVDLTSMSRAIAGRAKAVALMGQTSPTLHTTILACDENRCLVSDPQPSFKAAFDWANEHSAEGDVIVLSPGCASYDWFQNFADRGAQFIELVREYERSSQQ